jgi:SIR2-like domain/TIR domain
MTASSTPTTVIPVLLEGGPAPALEQVPSSLRPLLRRQAATLSLARLDADVAALVEELERRDGDSNLKIFINYRREDSGAHALLLYEKLSAHFGADNVFLDIRTLRAGRQWLQEIRARSADAVVFLALIGPRWAELVGTRAAGDDYVREEIEGALRGAPDDRPPPPRSPFEAPPSVAAPPAGAAAPAPGADHYDDVLRVLLDSSLVVFLGPGANSADREEPWHDESSFLPDADELAAYLARKAGLDTTGDLAKVTQHVWETRPGDLYPTLRRTFGATCPPSSVHRFLAGLPGTLERMSLPKRYPLIVTTNYDGALERAFAEADEPFDLAVYVGALNHPDNGKFVHVPHEGEPRVAEPANGYTGFPFRQFDSAELERTVIVKIHGGVDFGSWRDNFVIKEDDYIDYLSRSGIDEVVPLPIKDKLRNSQLLFLGLTMRDWNLRVFLQRMFGQHVPNGSWAIQRDPTKLDARFWRNTSAELYAIPLARYVAELAARIEADVAVG